MEFDATAGGPDATSYLSIEDADDRSALLVNEEAWDAIEDEDGKKKKLMRAAAKADAYGAPGPKADPDQRLRYPRIADGVGVIPEFLKQAVMEIVDGELSEEMTQLKTLQAEGVTSVGILGQSYSMAEEKSGLTAGARRLLDRLLSTGAKPLAVNRETLGAVEPGGIYG
ncbi:MAG TPA: DnaT-like ssDNA-binding protein [Planctomycetota bacterium]|nr:DnaT-like ssDNA-binding protein [Planctomycetota bacterium]